MLTLLAGTKAWTPLASLPRSLFGSRASLVGGNMRLVGGEGEEGGYRNEVKKTCFSASKSIWPILPSGEKPKG